MSNNGLTVSVTLTGENRQLIDSVRQSRDEIDKLGTSMDSSGSSLLSSLGSFIFGSGASSQVISQSGGGSTLGSAVSFPTSGLSYASSGFVSVGAGVFHTGGNPAVDGAASTRYIHPAYFENAPRFHTGIGPGEIPAIIQPSDADSRTNEAARAGFFDGASRECPGGRKHPGRSVYPSGSTVPVTRWRNADRRSVRAGRQLHREWNQDG